jgi:hypothetical protein
MTPELLAYLFIAACFVVLVLALVEAGHDKRPAAPDDLEARPARVIELPPIDDEAPCPEIAALVDKPDVVAVTPRVTPKMTPREALQAANRKRSFNAECTARAAAAYIAAGTTRETVAISLGYSSLDSMRHALNRYRYRANGQPREAAK